MTHKIHCVALLALASLTSVQSRRVRSQDEEEVASNTIGRGSIPSLHVESLDRDAHRHSSPARILASLLSPAPTPSNGFVVSANQDSRAGHVASTSHVGASVLRASVQMQRPVVQEQAEQETRQRGVAAEEKGPAAPEAPVVEYNSAKRFERLYMDDSLRKADKEHELAVKEQILGDWLSRMEKKMPSNETLLKAMSEKDLKRFKASSGNVDLIEDGPNPMALVKADTTKVVEGIVKMLSAESEGLQTEVQFWFKDGRLGKQFRSTAVTLMAKALVGDLEDHVLGADSKESRLAQVTEMIHTASLIHDDVLDNSEQRRGERSTKAQFGNYFAALTGDFLMSRATLTLSTIGDNDVTQIMAGSLEALVTGELVQLNAPKESRLEIKSYLAKSYFKTASLIASALRSVAVLVGNDVSSETVAAAEAYGFHMGLTFQVVDDILDFTSTADDLGKPAMADVKLGLATAPIIYAAEENPALKPLILRKFKQPGDVEMAYTQTLATGGIARAYELASYHANAAKDALLKLPPSVARDGLEYLNSLALKRTK